MIYVILLLSLVFIGLGFLITNNNASYLLSGYNRLSAEEQQKIDIKPFIQFFRNFHIFLGGSFLVLGLILLNSAWFARHLPRRL